MVSKLRNRLPIRMTVIAVCVGALTVVSGGVQAIKAYDHWETQIIQDDSPPCAKFEHKDGTKALRFENNCDRTKLEIELEYCKGVQGSVNGRLVACSDVERTLLGGEDGYFSDGVYGDVEKYEKGDVVEAHYNWTLTRMNRNGTIIQRATFRGRRDSGGCACGSTRT